MISTFAAPCLGSAAARRLAAVLFALALGVPVARATWSIVIVDTETKEVAIGSATCLTDFDLERWTPVLLVGVGGATAQSYVDSSGSNRRRIWDQFNAGTHPDQILRLLSANDSGHQTRQYGIVDTLGRAVTFTGTSAGKWAGGVTGRQGNMVYAIQGNVLTGEPVVSAAETAVLETEGDLAAKLMAGMEAARLMGGDGRCSCNPNDPDGCGSPPPQFEKSAHIAYMILARAGDTDGTCNVNTGCASGDYFMDFNIAFQREDDEDPVKQIRKLFDAWRDDLLGRPDAVQSIVELVPAELPPDGVSTAKMKITLRDWTGAQLGGGTTVTVEHETGSAGVTSIGSVTDNGDGTYDVVITAGTKLGVDIFRVTADDGIRPVRLIPPPTLVSRWLAFSYPDGQPGLVLPAGGTRMRVAVGGVGDSQPADSIRLTIVHDDGKEEREFALSEGVGDVEFPPTACGAPVRYFISAPTQSGQTANDPLLAPDAVFATTSGAAKWIRFADNFEDDLGWEPENLGASRGDWQRGVPVNDVSYQYDPPFDSDFSGQCWMTDNRRGSTDVDDGAVRLNAPVFDASGGVVEIRYDYFLRLTSQDGKDKLLVEINSAGGEGDWAEIVRHETDTGKDTWLSHTIDQAALDAAGVEPSATMQMRFTVNDDDPQGTVEAALDAFRVLVFPCEPPFERGDVNCDGDVDFDDIDAFVLALTDEHEYRVTYPGCFWALADVNGDGDVNFDDIDGFVECIIEGGCQ